MAHHDFLEAQFSVVPEPLDHRLRATHQQLGLARPAIAFGENAVDFRVRGGVGLRDEDVAAQEGPREPAGARRRLAIRVELADELVIGHVLAGEPAVAEGARAGDCGRHGAGEPELHRHAGARADPHPVQREIAPVKGHALSREKSAQDRGQLFQPTGAAHHGDAEGLEGLDATAVGEGDDEGSLGEGGEGADLLGKHDGLVERCQEHHADGHGSGDGHEPSDGRHGREGVRVGAGDRVVVAEE